MARRGGLPKKNVFDVIIVGGGPAGLSAALMLARARRSVIVIDHGQPRNAAATNMHGYLSRDGINPRALLQRGREELRQYGVSICDGEVVGASRLKRGFAVMLRDGTRARSHKLLLATGVRDELPRIQGFGALYGSSIHHCPYCDGWEWRDQRLAALGAARHGLGLALSLKNWSDDVVVLTNGPSGRLNQYRAAIEKNDITIIDKRIVRLEGSKGKLKSIVFADGSSLLRDALFFNTGQRQKSALAASLGCEFHRNGGVVVDKRQQTCVPGLYVCGDALREVQFVVSAAADGVIAAAAINAKFQEEAGRTL